MVGPCGTLLGMSIGNKILTPVLLFCLTKFPVSFNFWYSEDTITNYQLNPFCRTIEMLTVV